MFLLRCRILKEIAIFDRNRNNPRILSQLTLVKLGKVAARNRFATFPSRRWTIQLPRMRVAFPPASLLHGETALFRNALP
jgi:hypothetical protein